MTESFKLLSEYVRNGSEAAFQELVSRYVGMVYSTALRLVNGNKHSAEDITQTVFVELARKAHTLEGDSMLGGWLHRHTCFVAGKALRSERRRLAREQIAAMESTHEVSDTHLKQLLPVLDAAINQLRDEDRAAILLRFFEERDFRSVGTALGSNEDAARMRVNRALEKLHTILTRQGVTLSAAALGTALSSGVVSAAPAGLAISVTGVALAAPAATTAILFKTIFMSKLKTAAPVLLGLTAVVAPLVVHHNASTQAAAQEGKLQKQQAELQQLAAANARMANQLQRANSAPVLSPDELNELLRLRSEVGSLKRQLSAVPATTKANTPVTPSKPATNTAEEQAKEELKDQFTTRLRMSYAKQWLQAFHSYAGRNGGAFPTNFIHASPFLEPGEKGETEETLKLSAADFDIVYQGSLKNLDNPQSVVVLESAPQRTSTGVWNKIYGFADGHVQMAQTPDGDFSAVEKDLVFPTRDSQ